MKNKLSLEELDKLMIKDLKRAYNLGINSCIVVVKNNKEIFECNLDKEIIIDQLKKLLLKTDNKGRCKN